MKKDTYVVDFSQFSQLIVGGGSALYKIEQHLDAMQKDIHRLASGSHECSVITQTKEQRIEEMRKLLEEQKIRAADGEGPDT